MLSIGELCRARGSYGKYEQVICLRMHKKSARVRFADGAEKIVSHNDLWKMKPPKRPYRMKGDVKHITRRLGRHRKPIQVIGTNFQPGVVLGNFGQMLNVSSIKDTSVCVFNDNFLQWEQFGLSPSQFQPAGGGNACARPWQHLGHSIGMPTGPFMSLNEECLVRLPGKAPAFMTAADIIEEALRRIVRHMIRNPHKTTIYFSAHAPNSTRLGLGIFAGQVGDDVIDRISDGLQMIPQRVHEARVSGVMP